MPSYGESRQWASRLAAQEAVRAEEIPPPRGPPKSHSNKFHLKMTVFIMRVEWVI